MKNYFRSLFSFSRKELNGILVLSVLLFLFILSHPVISWVVTVPVRSLSTFDRDTARFVRSAVSGSADYRKGGEQPEHVAAGTTEAPAPDTVFPFDPNTVPMEKLLVLGLRKRVALTLLNYRAAGGRFYEVDDLKKVYGLDAAIYRRLQPYIRIQGSYASERRAGAAGDRKDKDESEVLPKIRLNTADSAALLPLPGIGPVLSARIVRYRERLGGFHSAVQLLEVYGLDTSVFKEIKPRLQVDADRVQQMNLNAAGYKELRRLPYWSSRQIRTVLNYRLQHSGFSSLEELYGIHALERHIIQKVMPYLSLENQSISKHE